MDASPQPPSVPTSIATLIQNVTHPVPVAQSSASIQSDLVRNLEMTGMASVAAARAATQTTLLPTEPLPPKSLEPAVPTISTLQPPAVVSQLSQETADADAQISQLLETLQKDPQKLAIEGEKMAEFIQSLTGSDDPLLDSNPSSPPKPKVTKVAETSTGFQASFLNSIAKPSDDTKSISRAPIPQQVLQQVSRGDLVPSTLPSVPMSSTPAVVTPTVVSGTSTNVPLVGGASTQMRALQNLPPNTRLVKGPNGQYSLQKIQTIELSQEMQQVIDLSPSVNCLTCKLFLWKSFIDC